MTMPSYRSAVLGELSQSRFADHPDNFDRMHQGEEPAPPPSVWRECVASASKNLKTANGLGAQVKALRPYLRAIAHQLAPEHYYARYNAREIQQGEFLYNLLADEPSKALLVKLIAFRILGHRKVKLPRNNPAYWQGVDDLAVTRTDGEPVKIKFMDATLAVHDLRRVGFGFSCHATLPGLACAILQKQYEYHVGGVHCKAEPCDVAIDAGCCWGETTMYFANEVGPTGHVVGFEFIPSNLEVLRRNIALNPHLKDRLSVVENPIWSTSGRKLIYVDWGPGSRVTDDPTQYHSPDGTTETVTIDETLEKLGLPRVDFIKMDIEGAELDALKGAEASIRRHRPKLAISLYHKPDDFETIPKYLAGLNLGYKFYLEHHTIYQNETVLFAVPQ